MLRVGFACKTARLYADRFGFPLIRMIKSHSINRVCNQRKWDFHVLARMISSCTGMHGCYPSIPGRTNDASTLPAL